MLKLHLLIGPSTPTAIMSNACFKKWRQKCVGPENGKLKFERLSLEVNQFNEVHSPENGRAFLQLNHSAEETKEAMAPEYPPKFKKSLTMFHETIVQHYH